MEADDRTPLKIRVVDTRRVLPDVTLMSPDELRTILDEIRPSVGPAEAQALAALELLVAQTQALRDRGPAGETPDNPQTDKKYPEPMEEVALRQLLYSDAVVPVIASPGAVSAGFRVRPGQRKRVLIVNPSQVEKERQESPYLEFAVAAEQPIFVEGLMVDPTRQGQIVVSVLAGGLAPRLLSGIFSAPVASVALAQRAPEWGPLVVEEGGVRPYSGELVRSLAKMLGSAVQHHFTGAGVYSSLTRVLGLHTPKRGVTLSDLMVSTGHVPASTNESVRLFVGELASIFADGTQIVNASPDEFLYTSSTLYDIFRVGAFGTLYYALTEGVDSPAVRRFFERAITARAEEHLVRGLAREMFLEVARARHYMIIIEDKLGTARSYEIAAKLRLQVDDPSAILASMSKREREIVTTEFANWQSEWEAGANNKCPHVRLAHRLRHVKSAREAMMTLNELAAYYVRPKNRSSGRAELEWILCKNCGFRAICPHVDELIKMQAENLPYEKVRDRLAKYSVQYSQSRDASMASTYAYFCRVCSEQLSEFTEEDRTAEILGQMGNLDDYVRKVFWVEAVAAAAYVRFPMPVDPRQFARTAVDICYPLLLVAEKNLLKRRRRPAPTTRDPGDPYGDEDTVDPRTRLYIVLFVYAYILNLIRTSRETSKPESRRLGFEGVSPAAKISVYAQTLLSAVLKHHSGLIGQIEDITPEYIADRYREAYRMIVGAHGEQELTTVDEAKVVVNELVTLNPSYYYAATAARVFGAIPVGRALTPAAAKQEFETVLGRSLPEVLADKATDSKSELVQKLLGVRPTARGTRRVAIEYPRGSDPLYVFSQPEVNLLAKMVRLPKAYLKIAADEASTALAGLYPALSHGAVAEKVGGKGGPKPFSAGSFLRADPTLAAVGTSLYFRSFRLFVEYIVDVVDAASMSRYQEQLGKAKEYERGYLLLRSASSAKNYEHLAFKTSRRYGLYGDRRPPERQTTRISEPDAPPQVPLSYLYDENGLQHTWVRSPRSNIYVYAGPDGELTEQTLPVLVKTIAADQKAGRTDGPIRGHTLVDVRCSTCKIALSQIRTIDEDKARKSLQAISEFDAFFAFYESRCPAGDLHDFAEVAGVRKCSKCGLVEATIFDHNAPQYAQLARDYYDRNVSLYRTQRESVTRISAALLAAENPETRADRMDRALEKYEKFARDWKYDYSVVVQAAELADVPVAALETLGATEGREYPEVLSGAGAPPPPASVGDPRLLVVDSDVRVFVSAYNRLRFVRRFPKVPPDVEGYLAAAQVPPQEYQTLDRTLPAVFGDYTEKHLALLRIRSPEDVLLFMTESLARMVVEIGSIEQPDWATRLGQDFAKQALQSVIRSERLLAKHGQFNFKIFGEDDIGMSLDKNEAPADDFGAAGEDVLQEIEAMAGEDGAYDPYSLEAVDIDDDVALANLEPA